MTRKISYVMLCAMWLVLGVACPLRAEEFIVGGTGSAGPLVEILFREFQKQAPGVTLKLVHPPMGTNGALTALAQDRVHLVMVGRPLAKEELDRFGQHFDLADTPFIMASSDGLRRGGFTLDELAQAYEGRLTRWDNGAPIRVILRGAFESDTLLLKDMSTALARSQEIARSRPGMAKAVNDIDTVPLIANTPGSLGPTTLGLLTTMGVRLHLFPLNGVAPTISNLKNGKYPWHKKLTVVLPLKPTPVAAGFAAFLRTAKARELLLKNDYLPVAQ